ncbi:uncharacterized protein LOC125552468 [Triticum urartu]|uniref:uncharacterized protein LOC125552468 n=1 Tax=Triticum urartu TaxID=4572 RepID=UPI0020435377|nr:uncharacterized protein LOC125552468 [Triticum urartu]
MQRPTCQPLFLPSLSSLLSFLSFLSPLSSHLPSTTAPPTTHSRSGARAAVAAHAWPGRGSRSRGRSRAWPGLAERSAYGQGGEGLAERSAHGQMRSHGGAAARPPLVLEELMSAPERGVRRALAVDAHARLRPAPPPLRLLVHLQVRQLLPDHLRRHGVPQRHHHRQQQLHLHARRAEAIRRRHVRLGAAADGARRVLAFARGLGGRRRRARRAQGAPRGRDGVRRRVRLQDGAGDGVRRRASPPSMRVRAFAGLRVTGKLPQPQVASAVGLHQQATTPAGRLLHGHPTSHARVHARRVPHRAHGARGRSGGGRARWARAQCVRQSDGGRLEFFLSQMQKICRCLLRGQKTPPQRLEML